MFVSLDEKTAEERYRHEPADNDTPERKFIRQWARTVLVQAMARLEDECGADTRGPLLREVKGLLAGERDNGVYAGIAQRLAMSEGAIRVGVHRLRQRYGELLRSEVAQTVREPGEIEEELRHLLAALRPA
jgi:RNA polymerase sigma-70 factor (ECF subfamily)